MTVYQIPLSTLDDFDQQVDLDGSVYILRFRWNSRAAAYFMDLSDEQGAPIVMGRRCVVDVPLNPFQDARPPGVLMLFDTTLNRADLTTQSEFGSRIILLYSDAAELAA